MKHLVTNANCKILSMVLTIALIFSMLPVTAFAETAPDDNAYATSGVTVSGTQEVAPIGIAPFMIGDLGITGGSQGTDYIYSGNVLTIKTATPLIINEAEGGTTTHTIVVDTGITANITLNNVNIDVSGTPGACAFDIKTDATVNLTLMGENTLKSGANKAGLQVPDGATLTIGGTGSLMATGDYGGAGIGGGGNNGGTVTIDGGTVTANGGQHGAGIGGGSGNNGGTVEISGGTVKATGGSGSAGIGGGSGGGNGGAVTISGGTVKATGGGGASGAGIGGGYGNNSGGNGGDVTISGGTVEATGGSGGAGIGGCHGYSGGNNGTLEITGGSVKIIHGASADANQIAQATNGSVNVYLSTLTLDGVTAVTKVTGLTEPSGYGITDVYTDAAGILYFYLPEADDTDVSLTANSKTYSGKVSPNTNNDAAETLKTAAGDATIRPTTATFDKNPGVAADVTVTFTLNGRTLSSVKLGGTALINGTDYSYTASSPGADPVATLKKAYLSTLSVGTHTITFDMNGGTDPTLALTVVDTTPTGKTDAEKVAEDKAALTFDSIKDGNTAADNITDNLTQPLPSSGANGSAVTWSSNNTAVIANDGKVTRPDYGAGDATVTLTATITIGTESDTVIFTLTVKQKVQKQTTVEVKPDTPQADATGLDGLFTAADDTFLQANAGALIEYRLEIEQITAPAADASLVAEKLTANTQVLYLDVSLFRKVLGANNSGDNGQTQVTDASNLIAITITLPTELRNKAPYTIIRVHDDGSGAKAETITPTYDSTLHTLTFTTDKFSTYAIAYTLSSPNPPSPSTSPSSNGGSSSGGGGSSSPTPTTQWIEVPDAKALAKSAKEQGVEIARSRRSAITGIRKASLLLLSESGLRYQHDTVANSNATTGGYVQVRVYVDDPSAAAKDIFVSGYVAGARTEQIDAKFGKWFTNKFKVISMEQQGDFGMKVRVAAKVDLSGMDTSNLYFYGYDKATNKYKLIVTEYRIDSKGYLHFATILAGDIIVSDGALTKKSKQQNADNGTYNYLAQTQLNEITNDTGDGTGVNIQPEKAQPQDFAVADSIVEAVAADGVLKLQSRTLPAAINNMGGEIGGALVFDLDAHAESADSNKSNLWLLGSIGAIILLIAVTVSWALIPRKDDPLVSVEEYRKK